jgi:hypothetical protein
MAAHGFFLYGFRKNERASTGRDELKVLREVAKELLGLDDRQLATALSAGASGGMQWQPPGVKAAFWTKCMKPPAGCAEGTLSEIVESGRAQGIGNHHLTRGSRPLHIMPWPAERMCRQPVSAIRG